ncbi:MAG: hypothetical protein A2163_09675 [Actinobacteria bacterium RBG_13_35_12]|nr:MAG: hypothetical protein A2163_09675 [Actinobacteria bacterium RBG_13_35_12]
MILSHYKLKSKILADRYNSIIFEKGRGRDLYLVGGYIRDILRGINSPDRDYVVSGDIISFVNEIRNIIGGTIVKFKKGGMTRLALKDGLTFDFSVPMGILKEDLSKRDFTINAIAWSPESKIIDPYNGIEDIKKKRIRSISEKNIINDPLRMLRAYRFAAELNGVIEKNTRKTIKMFNKYIKKSSSERITLEFFNLLNSPNSSKYLKMALTDGLLNNIILLPNKTLEHNIKEIYLLENRTLIKIPLRIKVLLNKIISQNLTYKGLLSLQILLKNGISSKIKMHKIKISKIIRGKIDNAHKGILKIDKNRKKIERRLFDIFLISKESAIDVLIIKGRLNLISDYKRFIRIWKNSFLSSKEIINISKIEKNEKLGKIIKELKKAQFEGRVKNRMNAIKYISCIFKRISCNKK